MEAWSFKVSNFFNKLTLTTVPLVPLCPTFFLTTFSVATPSVKETRQAFFCVYWRQNVHNAHMRWTATNFFAIPYLRGEYQGMVGSTLGILKCE